MKTIHKSAKLANVCYDIRGPVLDKARQMEEEGHKIIKLNIGNLAVFGFDAPEEIQQDMIRNLPIAAAYSDSKGIFAARKAVMQYSQEQGVDGVTPARIAELRADGHDIVNVGHTTATGKHVALYILREPLLLWRAS